MSLHSFFVSYDSAMASSSIIHLFYVCAHVNINQISNMLKVKQICSAHFNIHLIYSISIMYLIDHRLNSLVSNAKLDFVK